MSNSNLFLQTLATMSNNPQQIEAINETGHCVVLAGPGSGKTKTLTMAIARALSEDVLEPRGIACVTYNNECALELETKLRKLGIEPSDRIFIGTVHSFAFSQIILPYARCVIKDFPSQPQIATKDQVNQAKILAFQKVTSKPIIQSNLWQRAEVVRRTIIDRDSEAWKTYDKTIVKLIQAYESELRRNGLIDIEDMPLLAARLVIRKDWIRQALRAKYPILFVDEYQDLGTALHELVLQLCFESGIRLFAVGDPDQSIYRFIGANPKLLKDLTEHPQIKKIQLPFNYRCGTSIIEVSNAALGEERDHKAPPGTDKGVIEFDKIDGNLAQQASYVIKDLVPKLVDKGVPLEKIAVLYRYANDGDILAQIATENIIPIIRADKNALILRSSRLSRFIEACSQWVTGGWKSATPPFQQLCQEATRLVYGHPISKEERKYLERSLLSFLHKTTNFSGSTHNWLITFKKDVLVPWFTLTKVKVDDWSTIDTMIQRTSGTYNNPDLSLLQFSGHIAKEGRLNLSTLHSSKGREFDVVILFNMNQGNLPRYEPEHSEDMYETRRLFYVGVTRARHELHLVFQAQHYSPWVVELSKRLAEKAGTTQGY